MFVLSAEIKVCFEAQWGQCMKEITVFQSTNLHYRYCNATEPRLFNGTDSSLDFDIYAAYT
ncbi:hypothetical protein KUTeg_002241 [Tegillarca granosa]|uniref:Uncharacterized protein n=1 Tax=Tegillarca granosa TaxID=220873 RepID=A0ABQ9FTT8_TEGGR|nr:hypothetical protein KUTeg_002241 [Tegillarca granosa]